MCVRVCCALHALWGILYTAAGSIQLVAGVFFLLSLPIFRVGSNIFTGVCNVLIGVGTVMLSCFGDLNKQRSHKLIVLTFLALGINVANLVVLEMGEWYLFLNDSVKEVITQHEFEELVYYARVSTSLTTLAVIAVSFLDSQLTYCSLQFLGNDGLRHGHINETVSDIEYIIPRHKTRSISSKQSHALNQYTQSWVFDAETGTSSQNDSPYLKMPSAPLEYDSERDRAGARKLHTPSPGVRVQADSGSEGGDRQLNHMKSFPRTPSPGSHCSGPSPDLPIYECLQRVDRVPQSRLDTFLAEDNAKPVEGRSEYAKPVREKMHHASLMVELEKTFVQKKESRLLTQESEESDAPENRQRGSDAEFSKELEAALKLIQDLESPNTIDTPSETCRVLADDLLAADDAEDSECSSKTLSGKHVHTLPVASHSQSTSGYNSPTPSPEHKLHKQHNLAYVVHHRGDTAVITLYSPTGGDKYSAAPSDKIYVNKMDHGRTEHHVKKTKSMYELESRQFGSEGRNSKLKMWKIKRLLDRKRRPSLLPELESAIVKSESLAFLTDSELDERLRQSKHVYRQIEAKIQQKINMQRAESFGSVEDFLDDASSVTCV